MRSLLTLVTLSFTLASASPAAAEDRELARQYLELGAKLHARGEYAEALQAFERSARHARTPEAVEWQASCQEHLGHLEQAIRLYAEYQRTLARPDPLLAAKLDELRRRVGRAPASHPAASRPASAPRPVSRPEAAQPPASRPAPEPPPRPLRAPGWACLIGGGIALVIGGIVGGQASAKARALSDASSLHPAVDFADYAAVESRGKGLQTGALVALGIGGAALLTGAVLLMIDRRSQPAEAEPAAGQRSAGRWLAPVVAPAGGGVAGGLRF